MKIYKKSAVLLPRSANLHLRRLLRKKVLPTLAMDLRKGSQSEAGKLLATELPRMSLISIVANPKNTRTTSILGPLQGQPVLSPSHLFHSLIADSIQPLQNLAYPYQSPKSTTAPWTSPIHYQDHLQR